MFLGLFVRSSIGAQSGKACRLGPSDTPDRSFLMPRKRLGYQRREHCRAQNPFSMLHGHDTHIDPDIDKVVTFLF